MPDTENAATSPSDDMDTEQNERARRSRALKKGKLIFNRGLRSVPCIVRNLSESGAKLEFEQAYLLPQEFILQIDLEDFEVTCQRRWEDGLRCGVEFISGKRSVGQMRSQTLKSSDDALTEEIDELRDSPDNFFSRKRVQDEKRRDEPDAPARRESQAASSEKGFGRRR
ncbi:MAG: PilZ domain-containing protein [Roseibium sp.]|uniref:PilZ domain-containing protein n=1 Tax=Roseibium sp. TaxID=1936156 RepID=UPI003D9C3B95